MLLVTLLACLPDQGAPTLVMTGWEYEWATLSHRIGYLRAAVNPDSSLDLGLIGGDWSTGESAADTPSYRIRYAEVQAARTDFVEGSVTLDVGPEGTADAEIVVDVSQLPDRTTWTALLQGFSIDPAVPQSADYPDYPERYGYTTQGFAFTLGDPVQDGDQVVIPVTATIRWSPQDRDDMNAAIPYAHTGVEVRALLVATDGSVQETTIGDAVQYPEGYTYTDQPPLQLGVTFDGPGDAGFVGWRAIDLQGNFAGPDRGEGDYVRTMGVELEPVSDGPTHFEGAVTATFTNSSLLQLTQWWSGFHGTVARVGVPTATITHYAVSGSHAVGIATTGPTR